MEYSLLKLLVESMEERVNVINHNRRSDLVVNNEFYAALCEFIAASKKLMRFF